MTSKIEGRSGGRTIERHVPPQALIDAANPAVRAVAESPAHGLVDESVLVLHVIGRKTGRQYDIPVNYVELGAELQVVTQHRWCHNLRGGVDLRVTRNGERQRFHADLDERPAAVAGVLAAIIDQLGWHAARHRLGLHTSDGEAPTLEELTEFAAAEGLAVVTLSSEETWADGAAATVDPNHTPIHWFGERAKARFQRWSTPR